MERERFGLGAVQGVEVVRFSRYRYLWNARERSQTAVFFHAVKNVHRLTAWLNTSFMRLVGS